jgi:hypothetical protein
MVFNMPSVGSIIGSNAPQREQITCFSRSHPGRPQVRSAPDSVRLLGSFLQALHSIDDSLNTCVRLVTAGLARPEDLRGASSVCNRFIKFGAVHANEEAPL